MDVRRSKATYGISHASEPTCISQHHVWAAMQQRRGGPWTCMRWMGGRQDQKKAVRRGMMQGYPLTWPAVPNDLLQPGSL
jgi:hypothetical protein